MVRGAKAWKKRLIALRSFVQVSFVHCDTTYSDSSAADRRGSAVAAVEMGQELQEVRLRGVLADGRAYDFGLDDPFVGRQTQKGRWVKARLDNYRVVSGDGARSLSYAELSQEELTRVFT